MALGKQMWSSDHLQISLGTNQCSQPRGQIRQTNSQEFQRHPKSSAKKLWLKSCPKVSFARASGKFTSFAFSVGPIHSSLPLCFFGWFFCPRLNMVRREAKWIFPCPNYQSWRLERKKTSTAFFSFPHIEENIFFVVTGLPVFGVTAIISGPCFIWEAWGL